MGSSIGGAVTVFTGVRVSYQPTYVPAYTVGGKRSSQKLKFKIIKNSNKGIDARTGDKGRKDSFALVAFGELADRLARSMAPGTEFSCQCRPQSFPGKACDKNGIQYISRDGQPAMVDKVNFVITEMFGIVGPSAKQIERETIGPEGVLFHWRPRDWDRPGTNGPNVWNQLKAQRNAYRWDGRSPENGFAKVDFNALPQGAIIDISSSADRNGSFAQNVATVANAPQAPAPNAPMFQAGPAPAQQAQAPQNVPQGVPQFQVNTGQSAPAPAQQWANQKTVYPTANGGQTTSM